MGYQNILLIEDDDDDQEIFLKAIGELSDSVNCVALWDAPQALLKLTKNEIKPDVIFLDLNMPVMNGQQFLKELKKNDALKNIPVIIFSTSASQATKELTRGLGAHDFITKPGNFDELMRILKPLIHIN